MSSPYFFEQSMRHYQDELRRNERRAQHLADLRHMEQNGKVRLERIEGLIARVPRLRRTRSARQATA